jgi:hypothetical protein
METYCANLQRTLSFRHSCGYKDILCLILDLPESRRPTKADPRGERVAKLFMNQANVTGQFGRVYSLAVSIGLDPFERPHRKDMHLKP